MTFQKRIVELYKKDLQLREKLIKEGKLSKGYNPEMESLHSKNATELKKIIEDFGFPFGKKVGKTIANTAWIIIQHSIGNPDFMRFCLSKMEENKTISNKIHLAYLTDRIAFFEGKPQLFGTQFDWNEKGELAPTEYDNLNLVNQRRNDIGLNSLEEQTKITIQQAIIDNQKAPLDYQKRKQEFDLWRKKVGWI